MLPGAVLLGAAGTNVLGGADDAPRGGDARLGAGAKLGLIIAPGVGESVGAPRGADMTGPTPSDP
jgi:hypothetical protein